MGPSQPPSLAHLRAALTNTLNKQTGTPQVLQSFAVNCLVCVCERERESIFDMVLAVFIVKQLQFLSLTDRIWPSDTNSRLKQADWNLEIAVFCL